MIAGAASLFIAAMIAKERPADGVDVKEALGAELPLHLVFRDEKDREVHLYDVVRGDKPILLSIAYYKCPMLCGLSLRNVASAVHDISLRPGVDYRLVTVSFDPTDGSVDAESMRKNTTAAFADVWPFWTGGQEPIDALLVSLGVRLFRDPASGQFAHPSVFFVLTPEGRISRYLYGVDVPNRDVKLALIEASHGKIGTTIDHVLLRCFAWDPSTRRYGLFITEYFRTGAALILASVAAFVIVLSIKDRSNGRRDVPRLAP
jgi:protein SCO1/2